MANTLLSCLFLQVSQIQIASFLVFCPFPAMFPVPLCYSVPPCQTKCWWKLSCRSHSCDAQSLPQSVQAKWNTRWSGIRWHERVLLKYSIAFKPCFNIKCLSAVLRIIWIAVIKDQFHLQLAGEWIPLNKNLPPCSLLHGHQHPTS